VTVQSVKTAANSTWMSTIRWRHHVCSRHHDH